MCPVGGFSANCTEASNTMLPHILSILTDLHILWPEAAIALAKKTAKPTEIAKPSTILPAAPVAKVQAPAARIGQA